MSFHTARVIHVIPAIPACPVRPKSGRSANARVYEYAPLGMNRRAFITLLGGAAVV